MIYDIIQTTRYDYADSVAYAKQVLRFFPVHRRTQHILTTELSIEPKPARQTAMTDFFGNHIVQVDIDSPHDFFKVDMRARVVVTKPQEFIVPEILSLSEVHEQALELASLSAMAPSHFLFPSRIITLEPEITHYAQKSFLDKDNVFEAIKDFMARIYHDFVYDTKATDVTTLPLSAFQQRRGVCQDFAHIMICGLRGLGIPCAYVSGYLRTLPPPGQARLQGADLMHAWVMAWCGEKIGWVAFDPTNNCVPEEDHIIVAIGRDYSDVAPVDGIIIASGQHHYAISVDVIPVTTITPSS